MPASLVGTPTGRHGRHDVLPSRQRFGTSHRSRYRSPVKRPRAADVRHWPVSTCGARGQSDSSVSVRVPVKRWVLLCRCHVARALLAQGPEVFPLEHRAAIEVVDTLARVSVNSQMAFESCAEQARLLNTLSAVWTLQPILAEIPQQPPTTHIFIQ